MHSKELLSGVAYFYKNLGDLTRLRILDLLLSGEYCVGDISSKLDVSQSAVSHQLRTLRNSNLVKARKSGQMVLYSIAERHIETILRYATEHIKERI